jgi:gluconolactonase
MNHPNGLAFSPDETKLYVSNTRPDPHLYVFDVKSDGTLANGHMFAEMPYVPAEPGATFVSHSGLERPAAEKGGVPDGLKVDVEGRIYCTGPGGTWVWEADGTHLGIIKTPELPANVGFGDADLRSLYMTCRSSVYMVRTKAPGIAPVPEAT